jgi:hypothetical protein
VFVSNKAVACAVLSGAQERLRSSNFYTPKDFEYVYEYGEVARMFGAVPEFSGSNARLLGGAALMLGIRAEVVSGV